MNVHGGKRPGAGRKKSGECQKTRVRKEVIERLSAEGMTPLDVILAAMKEAWERNDKPAAAAFAKDAAPYLHPRLQSVMHRGDQENPVSVIATLLGKIDGKTRGIPNP